MKAKNCGSFIVQSLWLLLLHGIVTLSQLRAVLVKEKVHMDNLFASNIKDQWTVSFLRLLRPKLRIIVV